MSSHWNVDAKRTEGTRMTVEMKAGAELNALIAERVMDDPRWDVGIEGCARGGRICRTTAEAEAYRTELAKRFMVGDIVPHTSMPDYSDDIAAAWEVVERMRELGYALTLFTEFAGESVAARFN